MPGSSNSSVVPNASPAASPSRQPRNRSCVVSLLIRLPPPATPQSSRGRAHIILSFWANWHARRDSNPRPPGSKPGALSTELRAHGRRVSIGMPARRYQDYARLHLRYLNGGRTFNSGSPIKGIAGIYWGERRGSNPRSSGPQPDVLTTTLRPPCRILRLAPTWCSIKLSPERHYPDSPCSFSHSRYRSTVSSVGG